MINITKNNMIIYHLLLSTIQKDDWLRCFFGLIKATSQTQMMIHKPLVLSSLVVFLLHVFTHYTIKQVMINFMDHVLVMILMTINMIDDIYA
jgi:hypothetical protein